MIRKYFSVGLALILLTLVISCSNKRTEPDVSKINLQLRLLRFEKDLATTDFEKIGDSIPFLRKKYGEFLDIFSFKVIHIGSTESPAYPALLKGYVTDFSINQLTTAVDKEFGDFEPFRIQITDVFKHFKYYFPNMPIPVIITCVTGLNQSIVTSDTILGIGLDKYLGSNCTYYVRTGIPLFSRAIMYKEKIPADCAKAWALTQFSMSDSASNLLSNMIYQGKVAYFTQSLLPNANDSIIIGLNHKQLEWCKAYESQMWTILVENKFLFNSENSTISKFIGEGPFTKEFGQNSSPKAACWIGWQIVKEYMRRHTEIDLKTLMAKNDYMQILRQSKYKP